MISGGLVFLSAWCFGTGHPSPGDLVATMCVALHTSSICRFFQGCCCLSCPTFFLVSTWCLGVLLSVYNALSFTCKVVVLLIYFKLLQQLSYIYLGTVACELGVPACHVTCNLCYFIISP